MSHESDSIKESLRDKKTRDAFISAGVDQTIPFQIRAMRLKNGWTQKQLAQKSGMKQERISTCENPNYGRFSLNTLKQLASAFDVALIVRFAPFSEVVEWESNLSSHSLEIESYDDEVYFTEPDLNSDCCAFLEKELHPNIVRQSSRESRIGSQFFGEQQETSGHRMYK